MTLALVVETEAGSFLTVQQDLKFDNPKSVVLVTIPESRMRHIKDPNNREVQFDQFVDMSSDALIEYINKGKCIHSINIGIFISKYCKRGVGYSISNKKLHFEYARWCEVTGRNSVTQRKFTRILKQDYALNVRQTTIHNTLDTYAIGIDMQVK